MGGSTGGLRIKYTRNNRCLAARKPRKGAAKSKLQQELRTTDNRADNRSDHRPSPTNLPAVCNNVVWRRIPQSAARLAGVATNGAPEPYDRPAPQNFSRSKTAP